MLPTKREAAAELLRRREPRRQLAAYINFTNPKYKQSGFSAAVCAALDMFIADMQAAVDLLQRCIALGVRFSLDDFGTGYSSLSYLRKLPVHTLKIDQSFVRDMLTDPDDLGIVKGVIELASVFRRQVVAGGVETLEHGAALRRLGCRVVQGYGIAKPMPAAQCPSWCLGWTQAEVWLSL